MPEADEEFAVPVIVAVVSTPTATVEIAKVAVVAPAATLTLAGTVTEAWLEVSVTVSPLAGAALESVTVPVDPVPPNTVAGLIVTDVTVGAFTFKAAEALVTPTVPVILAMTLVVMPEVVTPVVVELEPAAIVTDPVI